MATVVQLRVALKSGARNIIAEPGIYRVVSEDRPAGVVTIETPDHYAGVERASFRLRKSDRVMEV